MANVDTSLSTFPEQIDSFVELFDLPPSQVASAQRLQQLKMQPTLDANEQTELNNLVIQLGDYIIDPVKWNKFASALVQVETFFSQEVTGYIDTKQQEWSTYVNDFKWQGVWSNQTAYKFQNMVTYNGDLYLAKEDVPTATVPSNTTYWTQISAKGDKGDVGLNASYKGNWSSSTAYSIGDAVIYGGSIYYCTVGTTAGVNPTDATHWFLYDKVVVSATQPTTAQQGMVWIKLED